jgi:hypothetical protein
MPARQMTDEEAERIFGSTLIFIGLKHPSRPIAPHTNEVTDEKTKEKDEKPGKSCWKAAYSAERWERYADPQMVVFSAVSVMLPSQITHLRDYCAQGDLASEHERGICPERV